ncbi:uncharacterized protein LOC133144582 isoform X1 [Syngnathus typhle]|uniref:uncharacterized protein LOC133144582 isoform X1 n=1 Tax=Syngnathus typhle TaxID=161592 RepID=UPI002A6A0067|nr:uncharacterized protein LOC133144582 isoform X1 [Syngnathus typhle]
MTSDMTGYFAQKTPSFQTPGAAFQSASFAMKYWKMASALPGKLNMGIGAFGRVFTLDPSGQVEPVQGSLTDLPAGIWSRYEVCSFSASADIWFAFDKKTDIDAKVPKSKQVIKMWRNVVRAAHIFIVCFFLFSWSCRCKSFKVKALPEPLSCLWTWMTLTETPAPTPTICTDLMPSPTVCTPN